MGVAGTGLVKGLRFGIQGKNTRLRRLSTEAILSVSLPGTVPAYPAKICQQTDKIKARTTEGFRVKLLYSPNGLPPKAYHLQL